jgi:uncharacterized membrane protein
MSETSLIPRTPLILALLVGLCGHASVAVLTYSGVPFSLFPIIALVLAAKQLYHHYTSEPMTGDIPACTVISFFIGVFAHSAFLRVQYPEMGSNFIPLILTLLLAAWLSIKLGRMIGRQP